MLSELHSNIAVSDGIKFFLVSFVIASTVTDGDGDTVHVGDDVIVCRAAGDKGCAVNDDETVGK